jgi:hypothetical protein
MLEQDSQEHATKTARQRHLAIISRGLHGYSFLTTALHLRFEPLHESKLVFRTFFTPVYLRKMALVKGLSSC